jgi:hypothetical protein
VVVFESVIGCVFGVMSSTRLMFVAVDHVLDLVTVGNGIVGRFMSGASYYALCREMLEWFPRHLKRDRIMR